MNSRAAILLVSVLFSGVHAWAGEPPKRPLKALILPQVKFQNADLSGALQSLKQAVEKQSGGTLKVRFVLELPKDYKPRSELTLDLHAIAFPEALRYLGELAGVEFSAQGDAVVVRPKGAVSAAEPAPPAKPPVMVAPPPAKGLTGVLGKPPERVRTEDGVRRAMDGSVQPEQSGHVAHRSLNGWSTALDPKGGYDANCVHVATCPASCGCYLCICKKPPGK